MEGADIDENQILSKLQAKKEVEVEQIAVLGNL